MLMTTYYNLLEGTDIGGLMSDPVSIKQQTTAKNIQGVEKSSEFGTFGIKSGFLGSPQEHRQALKSI